MAMCACAARSPGFRGAHSSGHCYFTLKDEKARIEAVIWRTTVQGLRVKPAEGLEVIATGRVTTYPGSSNYQIVIDALEPAGIGALMALLEERKKKLAAEGLFDEAKKRKLPFLPRVIGVVTSPTGAVIRDMLAGFTERFPARVLVWPVRVQGETCAAEVAAAIRGFNALPVDGPIPRPDVLIVARGGGSLEDLWGFNEEIVARAAAASSIPLISAVGHETDWTLIDLVADARAPTPTKAAEWAVPKYGELTEQTGKFGLRLKTAAHRALDGMRTHLRAAARGLPRRQDLVALPRQRFDAVERRLGRALLANARAHGLHLARVQSRLTPRLLEARMTRARDRLDVLGRRATASLTRSTGPRRARLERSRGPPVAADHQRPRSALPRAHGRPRGARCGRPCSTASRGTGAIWTAAPSCWHRSATTACCSVDLRWCGMAQDAACGRWRRSPRPAPRYRVRRRPCRSAGHGNRKVQSGKAPTASPTRLRRRAPSPKRRGGNQGSLF